MFRTFETTFAGRPLVIETGKMAQLASGSCLVRYGDTAVHAACTISAKPREGVDFFPLAVDYEEKLYALKRQSSHPVVLTVPCVPCSPRISVMTCLS